MNRGVEIKVSSNSTQARQDLGKLQRSVGNIEKSVSTLNKAFVGLAAGIGAAFSAAAASKGINRVTDSLTNLENRVALVTGRTQKLNDTMDALYSISKRTRAPVDLAANTFNRFGLALKGTGRSSADILKAVTSINKAIAISGASTESARAALTQFGQGIASGTLRGEELNSVLEQAPRLAQAIADSMELPLGALRKVAAEGKITSEIAFEALLTQAGKLDEEFMSMEQTSQQAMVVMRDQIGRTVAEISKQLNLTGSYVNRINRISDYVEANRTRIVSSVVGSLRSFSSAFSGVIATATGITNIVGAIIGRFVDALPTIITPLRTIGDVFVLETTMAINTVRQKYRTLGLEIPSFFRNIFGVGFQGQIRDLFTSNSLTEFGKNLDTIGNVIDSYGRRWYNVGNRVERTLRRTKNSLTEVGMSLGLVEQRLFRFRYESFERLNKALAITQEVMKKVKDNFLASEFLVGLNRVLLLTSQSFVRLGEAIDNSLGNIGSKTLRKLQPTFFKIEFYARYYMFRAQLIIEDILIKIERKFAWLYDKVIGNSWWTDTMKETDSLAGKWLGSAGDKIEKFGNKVLAAYKRIFDGVTPLSKKLASAFNFTALGVDFSGIGDIFDDPANAFKKGLGSVIVNILKPLGEAGALLFESLRSFSPAMSIAFATAIAAGLALAFAPASFVSLGLLLRVGLAGAVGAAISSGLGTSLIKSGFFTDLGQGLGQAAGQFANFLISNIPRIIRAFGQILSGFAQGVVDTIGGIPGLLLGALNFLPGGGILTGLLLGGVTMSAFSGRFRGFIGGLFGTLQTQRLSAVTGSRGSGQGMSFLDSVILGENGGRRTLARFGAGLFAADAMYRQFTGSGSIGETIIAGGMAGLMFFGPEGFQAIRSRIQQLGVQGAILQGITNFRSAFAGLYMYVATYTSSFAGLSTVNAGFAASFTAVWGTATTAIMGYLTTARLAIAGWSLSSMGWISALTTFNIGASMTFALAWGRASAFASMSLARFSTFARGRIGRIAILLAGLATVFAGQANAEGENSFYEDGGAFPWAAAAMDATILALTAFPFQILDVLKVGFSKIVGFLGRVAVRGAFVAIGKAILIAGGAVLASIASFFALIPTAIIVGIGVIIAGIASYSIIDAIFGENIEKFFDNVLFKIKDFFGLVSTSARELRVDVSGTLKDIDKSLTGKEFNLSLRKDLDVADLSGASAGEEREIRDSIKTLDKNRKIADEELRRFGTVSEKTRKKIEKNILSVEEAIYDTGGGQGGTNNTQNLNSNAFKQLLKATAFTLEKEGVNAGNSVTTYLANRFPSLAGAGVGDQEGTFGPVQTRADGTLTPSRATLLKNIERQMSSGMDIPAADIIQLSRTILAEVGHKIPENLKRTLSDAQLSGTFSTQVREAIMDYFKDPAGVFDFGQQVTQYLQGQLTTNSSQQELETATRISQQAAGITRKIESTDKVIARLIARDLEPGNLGFEALGSNNAKGLERLLNDLDLMSHSLNKLNLDKIDFTDPAEDILEDLEALNKNIENGIDPDTLRNIAQALSELGVELKTMTSSIEFVTGTLIPLTRGDLVGMNSSLSDIGAPQLDFNPSDFNTGPIATNFVDEMDAAISGLNAKPINSLTASLRKDIDQVNKLDDEIKNLQIKNPATSQGGVPELNTTIEINEKLVERQRLQEKINSSVLLNNLYTRITSDEIGLVQDALALTSSGADINKVFALKDGPLNKIKAMSSQLSVLNFQLREMVDKPQKKEGGKIINIGNTGEARAANRRAAKILEEDLAKFIEGFNLGGTTFLDKIVEGLNSSGYQTTLSEVGSMSSRVLFSLGDKFIRLTKLKKEFALLPLSDETARTNALKAISEIEKGIANAVQSRGVAGQMANITRLGGDGSIDNVMRIGGRDGKRLDDYQNKLRERSELEAKLANDSENFSNADYERYTQLGKQIDFIGKKSQDLSNSVATSMKEGFGEVIRGSQSMGDFIMGTLDVISETILNTIVGSFVDSMFEATGMDSMFDGLFEGLLSSGDGVGNELGKSIQSSLSSSFGGFDLGSMFDTGLSWLTGGLGFLGLSQGGLVPNIAGSVRGRDSVPTMLTPGERVMTTQQVRQMNSSSSSTGSQVINLSITGDISRQTRKEVTQMLPQIAAGVNRNNKENNMKYR